MTSNIFLNKTVHIYKVRKVLTVGLREPCTFKATCFTHHSSCLVHNMRPRTAGIDKYLHQRFEDTK